MPGDVPRRAAMLAGAESIKVFGEYVAVRAEIAQISNLSATIPDDFGRCLGQTHLPIDL